MNFSRLPSRLSRWSIEVATASAEAGVDPLLIFAVMDRESLGGEALKPPGAGGVGDHGHGRGLMQIDDRAHAEWVSKSRWWDALENIRKGAAELALHMHHFRPEDGWGPVLASYNAGEKRVRMVLQHLTKPIRTAQLIAALDPYTTEGNYISDVLRRFETFRALCSEQTGAA